MATRDGRRWLITVIRADGSAGVSFFCVTPSQRSTAVLALRVAGVSFAVEAYSA